MVITFQVKGLRQLGERMRKLSQKMQTRSASRATGAAARVIKKAAIRNIQSNPSVDTALLSSAVIMKKIPKGQAQYTAEHIVTVKKKVYTASNPKGDRNTRRSGVFIEYGTVNMPAEPYLRRAMDGNRSEALDAMVNRLRQELDKEGA